MNHTKNDAEKAPLLAKIADGLTIEKKAPVQEAKSRAGGDDAVKPQ